MNIVISSLRRIRDAVYYDVVFEWEEIFARYFRSRIFEISPAQYWLSRVYCKVRRNYAVKQDLCKNPHVFFVMFPREINLHALENCIPIFMDAWSDDDIAYMAHKTRNCKLCYCTSLEIYRRLKNMDEASSIRYMPLSVSDVYFSEGFTRYNKSLDVIQLGRRNDVLHDYMMRYTGLHPGVEYVYTNGIAHGEALEYVSTKRGKIGIVVGRENFVRMLSSARVSLVSTPGMDNSRRGANGNDFLTPRFYESAVFGCAMVGRYRENEETSVLNGICPNINSFDQFAAEMDHALAASREELWNQNESFVLNSLTSRRAGQLFSDIRGQNPDMEIAGSASE